MTHQTEAIQAFCRHLSDLCDVLSSPYDVEAFEKAGISQKLQGTNCNVFLHHALYQWLSERVELSLDENSIPEQNVKNAVDKALAAISGSNMLSEFVETVAKSCASADALTETHMARKKHSLFFDLQGPIDLLGPEEVDNLLAELANSDSPLHALEALSSDVHLLEDLCFGPAWPQLCDALGRLVALAAVSEPPGATPSLAIDSPGASGGPSAVAAVREGDLGPGPDGSLVVTPPVPDDPRVKLRDLLVAVLGELVTSSAASSPPHAAELLGALAPCLAGLAVRMPVPRADAGPETGASQAPMRSAEGAGRDSGHAGCSAPRLLAAAAAARPFAVRLVRIAHHLMSGLAAEFHTLPLGCANQAARAACDLVLSGLAKSAPPSPSPSAPPTTSVPPGSGQWAAARTAPPANAHGPAPPRPAGSGAGPQQSGPVVAVSAAGQGGATGPSVELSALDLLVLMDPELKWWRRLCAATHGTQPLAVAAAEAQLPAVLEAALAAWAAAIAAAAPSGFAAAGPAAGCSSSPTHLIACAALLGGLVCANNAALWGGESAGNAAGGPAAGRPAASSQVAHQSHEGGRGGAAGGGGRWGVAGRTLRQLAPVQAMLGHLLSCFCALADRSGRRRAAGATATGSEAENRASGDVRSGGGGGGSVLLLLSSEVLSAAAAQGLLSLVTQADGLAAASGSATQAAGAGSGSGTISLGPLLQTMLGAAGTTAAAAAAGSGGGSLGPDLAEAETWLSAAASVLRAASDSAAGAPAPCAAAAAAAAAPGAAEVMSSLLRHVAGRLRGCAGAGQRWNGSNNDSDRDGDGDGSDAAAPAWTVEVVHAAVTMSHGSPGVVAALAGLYDTLGAVLSERGRRTVAASLLAGGGSVGGAGGEAVGPWAAGAAAGPVRGASQALLDLLLEGGGQRPPQSGAPGPGHAAQHTASPSAGAGGVNGGGTGATESNSTASMDAIEILAAHTVLSYCRTDAVASEAAGGAAAARLPAALQKTITLLRCAAMWLCQLYDSAGDVLGGGGSAAGAVGAGKPPGGAVLARAAAKLRAVRAAGGLARSCLGGQRALVAAGFARRVLNDVAGVLRSGEYDSPYLEPLPYADPLAALRTALADVLCWPGLLLLPSDGDEEEDGGRGVGSGASAGATGPQASRLGCDGEPERHRVEVLALLQELVTWLDMGGGPERGGAGTSSAAEGQAAQGGRSLPPQDAAVVSLECFSALVQSDPGAAAALERDTNIRWYLQNLTGTLEGSPGGGHSGASAPATSGSDLLLDLAWGLLAALDGAAPRRDKPQG